MFYYNSRIRSSSRKMRSLRQFKRRVKINILMHTKQFIKEHPLLCLRYTAVIPVVNNYVFTKRGYPTDSLSFRFMHDSLHYKNKKTRTLRVIHNNLQKRVRIVPLHEWVAFYENRISLRSVSKTC